MVGLYHGGIEASNGYPPSLLRFCGECCLWVELGSSVISSIKSVNIYDARKVLQAPPLSYGGGCVETSALCVGK